MNEIKRTLDHAYELASRSENYQEAIEVCNKVISQNPFIPDGLNTRARIYELAGDLHRAIDDISAAIEIEPAEPDYYFNRGRWYLGIGNCIEAVKDQTRVLELGEAGSFHYYDETAYFFRAAAYLRLSLFEEALADCVHVEDDFLIYSAGTGKLTKADIVRDAAKRIENNHT